MPLQRAHERIEKKYARTRLSRRSVFARILVDDAIDDDSVSLWSDNVEEEYVSLSELLSSLLSELALLPNKAKRRADFGLPAIVG